MGVKEHATDLRRGDESLTASTVHATTAWPSLGMYCRPSCKIANTAGVLNSLTCLTTIAEKLSGADEERHHRAVTLTDTTGL